MKIAKRKELNRGDPDTWLDTVWVVLNLARRELITQGHLPYDVLWGDVCLAMQWIEEDVSL